MPTRESTLLRERPTDDSVGRALFDRYSQRLVGLARNHLGGALKHKVDPEDVVQSAYKSFFLRYGEASLASQEGDALWSLLTLITLRKCADRARYFGAECRDTAREVHAAGADEALPWLEPLGHEPTPHEAAVLSETVEQLLHGLDEEERPILELSLQGFTTREIGEQLGRAERTVRLLRENVRHCLERMQREHL